MYQIPKRPTEPIEYTLSAHEGKEDAPKFTIKPLVDKIVNEFNNLTQSGKAGDALILAAKYGVKGWTGFDIEYSDVTGVDVLPVEWRYELGGKAIEISSLSEKQKN